MVSPNIQELGLSDELLEHYRKEVGEMAVGILDGKPFDSPIHMGILLTVVVLSQLAASPGSGVARLIFFGSYGFYWYPWAWVE